MGRCKNCEGCSAVLEFKENNKGSKNFAKKLKKYEKANPCTNPTAKRAKISEVGSLFAAGHGGKIRGEHQPIPSVEEAALEAAARKARPKASLKEAKFNQEAFDEYSDLVLKCTNAAAKSSSADVKLESRSMIPKMRGLLDPSVKDEVDYAEATKDTNNILAQWEQDKAAGTRAFIPDLQFRDECYAALKIFSCAEEESKLIPMEYIEMFGEDDGIGMYNQLVEIIGEQDKKCLPLINMCLRAWMNRLSEDEDGNIWADLSPLSFDKWKEEEMKKARARKHRGKTSYEMMMAVFGDGSSVEDEEQPIPRATKKVRVNTPSTTAPKTNSGSTRTSKLQKLGEVMRKRLLHSRLLRGNRRITKANEEIQAAIKEACEGELNANKNRSCHNAARRMEEILFTVGGAERVVKTLQYFKDRPAVQEVSRARDMMVDEGDKMQVSL